MENIKTITKFEVDDKVLYVKLLWKPNANDLFHIKIYDGDKTWSGNFSYESANKYRELFDETEDEYNSNVEKGLSRHQEFSYIFKVRSDDNNRAEFKWKKKFEDSDGVAMIVHGSVLVNSDDTTEAQDSLIDNLLAENENLRTLVDTLNAKNKYLNQDLEKCKSYLEECKDWKTSLETTLYGKFVQLLNAKKRRIQLLEENLVKISKSNHITDEQD